jgi:hypothetical protein
VSPLKADHSALPKAERSNGDGALLPDPEPRFVHLLAQLWQLDNEAQGDRPNAVKGSRFRFSDAGKCARAIAFKAAGFERTNPMDLSGVWNTRLGTMIHDAWQEAMVLCFPDAKVEVRVTIDDLDGSGHGDCTVEIVVDDAGRVVVIELKSIGGYGFKSSIGKASKGRPAEGPNTPHIIQGALAAKAQDADELVIGYLSKESLSVAAARGMPEEARFSAEWTFTRDEYEPYADAETKRVAGILDLLDKGELAARKVPHEMPPGAVIVDPASSRWEQYDDGKIVDTGTLWNGQFCAYCGWFDLCKGTDPGRIPVEQVVAITTKAVA